MGNQAVAESVALESISCVLEIKLSNSFHEALELRLIVFLKRLVYGQYQFTVEMIA